MLLVQARTARGALFVNTGYLGGHTMQIELRDQVALVTGSARRVGLEIALELARAGVHILVHYHGSGGAAVDNALAAIRAQGVRAEAAQADLSAPACGDVLAAAVEASFGRLDILVNSASLFPRGDLLAAEVADWDRTMAVNMRAPWLLMRALVPIMQRNTPPGGCIVNIVDRGAEGPWVDRPQHGISKAGLWALTQVAALSLAPEVRVNAVLPGPVMKTDDGMSDARWAEIGAGNPLGHAGEAGDVARAVRYLASERFLNGALIHVNGGEHLSYVKA
jgi:NAD(P)-dependent dehydrogenase (short-subunit alcohol dehydrogenase family)